jgi:hypothetical protein
MVLCQILYVSDKKLNKEKDDKENNGKVDKEKDNKEMNEKYKFDKVKFSNYSANELAVKLKQIGFNVGEICEDVDFDETQKIIYEKMFLVPEVFFILICCVQ